MPMPDERTLQHNLTKHFSFGIVFKNLPSNGSMPDVLEYKIRDFKFWGTQNLYFSVENAAPNVNRKSLFLSFFLAASKITNIC